MGVYESNAKIKKAGQNMDLVWEKTKTLWKDKKADQSEKKFIERFAVEVKRSMSALDNAGIMLNRIRSELKERG